jgi:hypothetical protein
MGASPSCWALYGDLLARQYEDPAHGTHLRPAVDAYAVQHPGVPERRSIHSVCFHLMRLCLVVERGADPRRTAGLAPQLFVVYADFRWLEPPSPNGRLTVADALAARDADANAAAILAWAEDVWSAWSAHHETVRGWLDR